MTSNKKKCLFYGNCQVIFYLHNILKNNNIFNEQYDTTIYVNHDRDNFTVLRNINVEDLQNCDVIIFQPLDDNHGVYSTNNILKFVKDTCIKISFPYIYSSFIYSTYFESASERWTIGTLINCGWRNIIKLILLNATLEEILIKFDNNEIDFYFEERRNICIDTLQKKEEKCNIKVSEFILNNYRNKRLFVTQNHLTDFFNIFIANNVLQLLNLNIILNYPLEEDITIESNCVYDKYNIEYHNFTYEPFLVDNNYTKNKIIEFYNFAKNKKEIFENSTLEIFKIVDDPEKFQ